MYDLNDDDVADRVAALPADARVAFDELCSVIALVPWRGESASNTNPDGEVRFAPFTASTGSGFVYYLILEDQDRVDLLELIWLG